MRSTQQVTSRPGLQSSCRLCLPIATDLGSPDAACMFNLLSRKFSWNFRRQCCRTPGSQTDRQEVLAWSTMLRTTREQGLQRCCRPCSLVVFGVVRQAPSCCLQRWSQLSGISDRNGTLCARSTRTSQHTLHATPARLALHMAGTSCHGRQISARHVFFGQPCERAGVLAMFAAEACSAVRHCKHCLLAMHVQGASTSQQDACST